MSQATLRVALSTCLLGLVACGGGSGGSSGSQSTTAPVTSNPGGGTAPVVTFRSLERGTQTLYRTAPVDSTETLSFDSAQDLAVVLGQHQGTSPVTSLNVDWSTERVVAIFLGERPSGGFSVEVTGVAQVDSANVEVSYRWSAPSGAATAVMTYPYEFAAIANTQGAVRFVDVTPAPSGSTLTDVHGALIAQPLAGNAAQNVLAFLPDGASDALELTDPSAIVAQGGGVGSTLSISGRQEPNPSGVTTLSERALVTVFALDALALTGELEQANGVLIFRTLEGEAYELTGPGAAAASSLPLARPLRLTGSIDPTHVSATPAAPLPGLAVSSSRPTTVIAVEVRGGLAGLDERYAVEDLDVSGADANRYQLIISPNATKRGRNVITPAERIDLAAKVTAAALHTQPARFLPPPGSPVVADVPTTYLELRDAQGTKRVEIRFNSVPPAEVTNLLTALQALRPQVPTFRLLEGGSFSRIAQAESRVARDAAELQALWTAHTGGGVGAPALPNVDWSKEVVVAVFMGQQNTGGYAIELIDSQARDQSLHFAVNRTSPRPGSPVPSVITSPFHMVAVERKAAQGALWVEGVRK